MKNTIQKIAAVGIALVVLGASFFAGVWFGYENRPGAERILNVVGQNPPPQFGEVEFGLFWDVWSKIEEKFVDRNGIDREDLVYGAISGLVRALDDPYSEFLPPAETKQFQEDIKGSFGGIGSEIGIRKNILTIIAPLKGSPAEKAGLKAGDQVLKVDDAITADLSLNEAVRVIRGEKGTPVRLLIFREGFSEAREFKVLRDTINVPILETKKLDDGIFVIELRNFTESAAFEFRRAVQEFFASNSERLILDLRNNPGGFLTIAIDIASWWVPPGETVAREVFSDESEDIYRSSGYRFLSEVPTVVLVNKGSASASEIVAGALRDARGIQLVGEKTFGKGSVQEVINLPKNSSLKITIAKWLTPKGAQINEKGLEPDIVVELPEKPSEEDADRDFILEKGIKVVKGL